MLRIIGGLLIFIFVGCKSEWDPYEGKGISRFGISEKHYDIESYKVLNDEVNLDSIIMPSRILAAENYLLISDQQGPYLIHIIDMASKKYLGGRIPRGEGPDEQLYVWDLGFNESNEVFFMDIIKRQFLKFDLDSLVSLEEETDLKPRVKTKLSSDVNPISLYNSENKNYYIDIDNGSARYYAEIENENKVNGYGSLLNKKTEFISDNFSAQLCEARITLLNNLVFISYLNAPLIEIYNKKGEMVDAFLGPDYFVPIYAGFSDAENESYVPIIGSTVNGYYDIESSTNYVYALYDGKVEQETFDENGNKLFVVIDKGGKLDRTISISKGVFDFTVYNDETIYGINLASETPEIVSFKIN